MTLEIEEYAYQKTIALLDEIQQQVTDGTLTKNARNCLMNVGSAVHAIRQELKEGIILHNGGSAA